MPSAPYPAPAEPLERSRPSCYFDAASAEPPHPAGRQALHAALEQAWADPARPHRAGRAARAALDDSRERVAAILGCRADEVVFTGSGTQAVHLAVLGALRARRRARRHLVVGAVEHSSVLNAAALHERDGGEVDTVPVARTGRVDPDRFAALLRPDTALACLQSANHEVGTTQPVEEVAEACARAKVALFVDAAQSLGRAPLPTGWSILAGSAHKWGGPPGVGLLAVRKGTRWSNPLPEDERESGRVPGFPNVPAVVAAAASLEAVTDRMAEDGRDLDALVRRIRERAPRLVPDLEVIGDERHRLPHIVTLSCLYLPGDALLHELDRAGFAVSSGSSCAATTLKPSHVLEAMGVITHGNLRVSLPRGTTVAEVDRFLDVLPDVVRRLRESAGSVRTSGTEMPVTGHEGGSER